MPATVIDDPLGVEFVLANGSRWLARLDGLANPRLAAELALGMAANAHPHGGITTRKTAEHYAVGVRRMVQELADQGFTGSAADLTRPLLMRYWLAGSPQREMYTRQLLRGLDRVAQVLRPEVREYLGGSQVKMKKPSTPYRPYSDGEWERLGAGCRKAADNAWRRHKEMLAEASGGADPRVSGRHARADMAALMLDRGPLTFEAYADYVHGYIKIGGDRRRLASSKALREAREALFPNRVAQCGYATLFGIYTGIVPDGVDGLSLDGVEWSGDKSATAVYYKGRTSRESLTLPGRAARLLERWVMLSAPLRRFAGEHASELWLSCGTEGNVVARALLPVATGKAQRALGSALGLKDDHGDRLPIHRGRIRATYEERLARRGWSGAATIDPNHSARVEGDHYVTPRTPERLDAVASIIEDGMTRVLHKALPPMVLAAQQAAELAAGFPEQVAGLGLDGPGMAELLGGERDVFTAACANQLAGLHGPAGQPCPARPWVCLLCPLAVFMPRHAPNLLRLESFFLRQCRAMPVSSYLRVFGPYADRLTNEILPKLAANVLESARGEVAGEDAELPLRPEEATA